MGATAVGHGIGLCVTFTVSVLFLCVAAFGILRSTPRSLGAGLLYVVGALLFFGGLLNFLVFWHVMVYIGGDAASGIAENGAYFVCSHGKFTRVSEATWKYSYAHGASTWITDALAVGGWLLLFMFHPDRTSSSHEPPESTGNTER